MLYLIGGIAKAGKSFVARKIVKEKQIPVFETDILLWGFGSFDGEIKYSDPDKIVAPKFEKQLINIIEFLIQNNEDYIIEGTYITTNLINKIKDKYRNDIRFCFLGYPNISTTDKFNQIKKFENDTKNNWHKFMKEEDFINLLSCKIEDSKELEIECSENNFKFFDAFDISKISDEIIAYLFN